MNVQYEISSYRSLLLFSASLIPYSEETFLFQGKYMNMTTCYSLSLEDHILYIICKYSAVPSCKM